MEEQYKKVIKDTIERLLQFLNMEYVMDIKEDPASPGGVLVSLNVENNAKFLIGKNGETLRAMEHILRSIVARFVKGFDKSLVVDVNDYKKIRASYVVELARQAVDRVRHSQRAEALLPMSPYERKIIHTELASFSDISTESIGEGSNRRIVIKPYSSA